jgi:hypothetical protein
LLCWWLSYLERLTLRHADASGPAPMLDALLISTHNVTEIGWTQFLGCPCLHDAALFFWQALEDNPHGNDRFNPICHNIFNDCE